MSECDALVVEVSGDQVLVEVSGRAPACGNCSKPDGCQGGLTGLSTGPRRYRLDNRTGARVGDRVRLTVADGTLWRASLASYLLPVLLAIAGAAVGQFWAEDPGAVAGMFAGLGGGLALLRRKEMRARHENSPLSLRVSTNNSRFKEST